MAVDIGFYHCTRTPLLEVAVRLAEKAHASGQRLLIAGDAALLAELDQLLWTYADASFLPHALTGALEDLAQPILLDPDLAVPAGNGARLLMLLARPVPQNFTDFQRVLNLFEAETPGLVQARQDWRALVDNPAARCSYWQQTEAGGWRQQGG